MSHSVTITRTTTTTNTTAILLNTGYLSTLTGLLKLAETILGAVCVGILGYYVDRNYTILHATAPLFFLLMTTTFMIGTFCLLLSSIMSISTASIIPKTLFEVIYHVIAFALLLAASLTFLIDVNNRKRSYNYEALLAAAIIGLVNTALYLLSTVFGFRSYRGL